MKCYKNPIFFAVTFVLLQSLTIGCEEPDPCENPDFCPDPGFCGEATCTNGVCEITFYPAGTTVDDSTSGDCRALECDGQGNGTSIVDDSDLVEDGYGCTVESCNDGSLLVDEITVGDSCSGVSAGAICHADGRCDTCTTDCSTSTSDGFADSQDSAHSLGSITDDDDDGDSFCETLGGPDDVDWYVFHGTDARFSYVNPEAYVDRGSEVRVCTYASCDVGRTAFVCPDGTMPDISPEGDEGCCSERGYGAALDLNCYGTDNDDATVWIKVENLYGDDCSVYELSYHY